MSILDHVTLVVSDYDRSKAFYEKALAPLGIQRMVEFGQAAGFGKDGKAAFWIGAAPASFQRPEHLRLITPTHLAFTAASRAEVEAFYAAALAAGGKDFGAPGIRAHYHPRYYGAFVLDPDGHDIEAVFHNA
jgi:catechol 2,3-dioxygenase-like lactoylglutathione lyase family enzyme